MLYFTNKKLTGIVCGPYSFLKPTEPRLMHYFNEHFNTGCVEVYCSVLVEKVAGESHFS